MALVYSFLCSVLITSGVISISQSPFPPLFGCMNKAGFLPSTRVMLSLDLKRYCKPLRLPIRPVALSSPYTPQSMASPPPQWVSRAARSILHNMPSLLPRESMHATSVIPAHFLRPSSSAHRVGSSIIGFEATSRFTCVTACCFAHEKLTTSDYSNAASRC